MLYQSLLLAHLLAVVFAFFMGGAIFVLRSMLPKAPTVPVAGMLIRTVGSLTKVMPFSGLALLVTGLALTKLSWSFTSAWIDVAIAAVVLMGVVGATVLKPRNIHLKELLIASPEFTPQVRAALFDPVAAAGEMINLSLAVAMVMDMTWKPTAFGAILLLIGLPLAVAALQAAALSQSAARRRPIGESPNLTAGSGQA